jgi:hypothetical protein
MKKARTLDMSLIFRNISKNTTILDGERLFIELSYCASHSIGAESAAVQQGDRP